MVGNPLRQCCRYTGYVLLAIMAIVPQAGCSAVGVRPAGRPDLLAEFRRGPEDEKLSPWSIATLKRFDLVRRFRRTPSEALARLQAEAEKDPQPDTVLALAEVSYALACEAQRWEDEQACRLYYLSAGYAYHYLFDFAPPEEEHSGAGSGPGRLPGELCPGRVGAYDPRFRLACDLYNAGLEECLRAAGRAGRLDPRRDLQLPLTDGRPGCTLSVVPRGFAWRPDEFGALLFCDDFDVVGLAHRHRNYGLGVPLICTRAEDAPRPSHYFYPRDISFPVTAFCRFSGTLAELARTRTGQLELYNTVAEDSVRLGRRSVPLETDLTTPLAYFVSRSDLEGIEYLAFVHADRLRDRTGIYMFEPYQPGKIPVLMVHGLLSSPLTWAAMFNDLRADPVLREKYQFWFYLYPSGSPWLAAAGDLRQSLTDLRRELDPRHEDGALDQMVVVGHSMGGLIAKLLTVESGNDFWKLVSAQPLEALKIQPETRSELQRVFYFESQPSIRRVIFIGTPHHGSDMSPSPLGKLAARVAQLPLELRNAARDALRPEAGMTSATDKEAHAHLPTSVDMLAPGAPALELLAARQAPQGVHYHSIIGDKSFDDPLLALLSGRHKEPNDGIVPVSSARIDGVESELFIPTDHEHVHLHPQAIKEVRRILLEHLKP